MVGRNHTLFPAFSAIGAEKAGSSDDKRSD
jgi:hypothetical protein